MVPRLVADDVLDMTSWFPVVSVTGPRQSGKSTLVRELFRDYDYVNLENPNTRRLAEADPVGFIRNRPSKLIIDEAQYVPELFSMVQVASDERGTSGQYILSGSQNFLLLKRITQSLAGRVGIVRLLPFSLSEAAQSAYGPSVDEFMLRGGYPRPYVNGMRLDLFFDSYLSTYIERDVSGYLDVRDVSSFRAFLKLCADYAGNMVNYANMARSLDVSYRTLKAWDSILESSYITFKLPAYFANVGKRLAKTPKCYFYDTGLLCYLLGIRSVRQLLTHPKLGAVFENLIIAETMKSHFNHIRTPELYFYRDDSKQEVDLLDFTDPEHRRMVEIKSGETYHGRFGKTLTSIGDLLGVPPEDRMVVYRGDSGLTTPQFTVYTAGEYLSEIV